MEKLCIKNKCEYQKQKCVGHGQENIRKKQGPDQAPQLQ